jgi:hypothetical protein
MRKRSRRILLAVVFCGACAHEPPRSGTNPVAEQSRAATPTNGTIALGCGYLVVENHGPVHFTVFLTGHDMQQVRREMPVFIMDDVLLEFATTTAAAIGQQHARGSDLLRTYLKSETSFISQTNHWTELSPVIEPVQSGVPGVDALRWSYEPPVQGHVLGRTVARVMYFTVAIDDVVFAISAPMRTEDDPDVVGAKLEAVIRTLRRSSTPLDVGDLVKQFEAIHDRRKVCAQWGDA